MAECTCRAPLAPIDRFGVYECPEHGYFAKCAEVERLHEALCFYADEQTYDSGPHTRANADGGATARAALFPVVTPEPEYHRCEKCGARDKGQQDWGIEHARRCDGNVLRPPSWHSPTKAQERP